MLALDFARAVSGLLAEEGTAQTRYGYLMMTDRNNAATQLWEQLFATMAKAEDAALIRPDHEEADHEARLHHGLAQAGWSEQEIQSRIHLHQTQVTEAPVTSPGVNPHVEFILNRLCTDIEAAMNRLHFDSHTRVARGVEPRVGPLAAMTNVIMTDEGIVTVGSFLFRFCGLVARAFTRTLLLGPTFWESESYSDDAARLYLKAAPEQMAYWARIFVSFAVTGTHIMVPYRPANRNELVFEQIARAMEIFAIAHEYGHHHLGHGRQLCADPILEEFGADQFALKIAYEVERRPLMFANPYLSSGAGGVILLKALDTLRRARDLINATRAKSSETHPDIAERLARFDSVAVLKPQEFAALKNFRTTSARIMDMIDTVVFELLCAVPKGTLEQLRAINQAT